MQPEKKQLEILLMHYFSEVYADFPHGEVLPAESPDFTVKLKNRNLLGIELTRLNPVNKALPDEFQLEKIRISHEIVALSKELFEHNSSLKLYVKFLFSTVKPIIAEKQLAVAVQLVNLIRQTVKNKKHDHFFREIISGKMLPEGIDEILIVNHPVMQTSVWERANNLGVSINVVDDICHSIQKKDEKLRIYHQKQLNLYWLLIITDRLRGLRNFNLPEKIQNHEFHSRFQHVFLFDLIKASVFQLV